MRHTDTQRPLSRCHGGYLGCYLCRRKCKQIQLLQLHITAVSVGVGGVVDVDVVDDDDGVAHVVGAVTAAVDVVAAVAVAAVADCYRHRS